MIDRKCKECGTVLRQGNTSDLCSLCDKKQRERNERATDAGDVIIDAQQYGKRLKLSAESIKRRARKNELAPKIPGPRKYQWRLSEIETWEKNKQLQDALAQELSKVRKSRRLARSMASNLRRLKNDNYIQPLYCCLTFYDVVFGMVEYLGTAENFNIDIIQLPKISKTAANGLFALLPAKDFPELEGVDDWNKLPLDRVTEGFLARLGSFF